jgi:ribosomal protein L32
MGGTKAGAGPGGQCVCPSCGSKVPHQIGVPCNQNKCPKCGNFMVRG